jgi:hypothetical protein
VPKITFNDAGCRLVSHKHHFHTNSKPTLTLNLTLALILTLTFTLTFTLSLTLTLTLTKNKHKLQGGGLKCVSLDDSLTLLKAYERILHNKYLKAAESIVIGKNHAEIEAAVDIIMGRKTDAWLSQRPADIVTLDQQLGHDHLQGTDIAATLAEEKFQGVVCILTGGSEEDMTQYKEMPGVDMVVSKATNYQQVAKVLLEKHVGKKAETIRLGSKIL